MGFPADHELGAIEKAEILGRILISISGHNTSIPLAARFHRLFNPLQRPNGLLSFIPPFPTPYSPYQLPHRLSATATVYLLPVTTNDVAHRGFRIRLGTLLRRRR